MASEWVTILVDSQGMRASVSEPDTSWTFPGILVIMETSGANTPPQEVTGVPSREGDAAAAPVLYHRLRSNPLFSSIDKVGDCQVDPVAKHGFNRDRCSSYRAISQATSGGDGSGGFGNT